MAKKKALSKKKPAAKKAAKRATPKKSAPKKVAKKKAGAKRSATASKPPRKKKTNSRAGTRIAPPSRPQPVPPGNEQPAQLAGEDEHGPMHIPSHKPAPAYAQMHQNDWAGKPPQHDIPMPKH